jgi:response regulator of citrate/malate metabolism
MSDVRQQDIFVDLPRGKQLGVLRSIKIDSRKVGKSVVSGAIQKSVLRAIDDHDGGRGSFATQDTLASELGISRASVGRAVAALVDQDLITRERRNHWSPNTHRVNWTALHQVDASTTHSEVSTATGDSPRELTGSGPLPHGDPRNARETQIETPSSTEWEAVVAELYRWGLKSAAVAVDAAQQRGWSIEYVRELFIEAGGNREPQQWEPGQLANWLTGKTPPPFGNDEAHRRAVDRVNEPAKRDANEIRESVRRDGQSRGVADFIIEGLTFRKLAAVELDRFATDAEQAAAVRLDELDRERSEKLFPSVNTRSEPASTANDEQQNRDSATASHTRLPLKEAKNQSRARTQNAELFQQIPLGNRGTRAFDQKRAGLRAELANATNFPSEQIAKEVVAR